MCTLTIVPTETGYLAAMNRDELHSRPPALPDVAVSHGETRFVAPREATGGTWIAGNERGELLALLNWNLPGWRPSAASLVSRGTVIPGLISAAGTSVFEKAISWLPLELLAPFRLVGTFFEDRKLVEVRWNGKTVEVLSFPWAHRHWFSSSASDERAAQERGSSCERAARLWPAGTSWLRRLHRSHAPGAGPFSVCVHRSDATTVSYTEVRVDGESIAMSYLAGSPCQKAGFDSQVSLPMLPKHSLQLAF